MFFKILNRLTLEVLMENFMYTVKTPDIFFKCIKRHATHWEVGCSNPGRNRPNSFKKGYHNDSSTVKLLAIGRLKFLKNYLESEYVW